MLCFKIRATKFCVTFSFFFVCALLCIGGQSSDIGLLSGLLFCACHELGHVLAMARFGASPESVTLYGGGIGLFTFKVGDLFHVKGDKSPNEMRLFISNPCTGSGSLVMGFTTVRLFCQNQIAVARRGAAKDGYRIQHSKNSEVYMGDAVREIGIQVAAAKEIKLRSERLAALGVGKEALEKCLNLIYPFGNLEEGSAGHTRMLKLREEVVRQFEEGETAQTMEGKTGWTLFNAFTYPVFNPEKLGEKTDLANIQYDSMMWSKAEKVRRMLTAVESVVAA